MGRDDEMVFTTYYDLSMFTIVKHETNFFKKIYLTHDYYAWLKTCNFYAVVMEG
jgi:hypothetical protein